MLSPPLGSVFFHYLLHYILDLGVFMAALEECLLGACGWLEVGNMAGPLSTKAKKHKAESCWFSGSAAGPTSQDHILLHTCPNCLIPKPKERLGCLVSRKCKWESPFLAVGKLWLKQDTYLLLDQFRICWELPLN